MTPEQRFTQTLEKVGRMFRQEIDRPLLSIWLELIADIDANAAAAALLEAAKASRFMPLPVDVRNLVFGDVAARSHDASSKILNLAQNMATAQERNTDPLTQLVVNDMGGWKRFGTASLNDWHWVVKDFEDRYATYLKNPLQMSNNLAAIGVKPSVALLDTRGINQLEKLEDEQTT